MTNKLTVADLKRIIEYIDTPFDEDCYVYIDTKNNYIEFEQIFPDDSYHEKEYKLDNLIDLAIMYSKKPSVSEKGDHYILHLPGDDVEFDEYKISGDAIHIYKNDVLQCGIYKTDDALEALKIVDKKN